MSEERKNIRGPNINSNAGRINNSYYFYNSVYTSSYDISSSNLALYDNEFQKQTLNLDDKFIIEENIKNGYFPTLKMPNVMPNQEYLKLPNIEDEDLPEIISSSIIESDNNTAKIELNIHNPTGESINSIKIEYLTTEIESQNFEDGKSKVIINIKNKAEKNETTENQEKNGIGGAEKNVQNEQQSNEENTQENEQTSQAKTQEEQDIENIKNTTTFIKPIEGRISSKYGQREPTTSTVPKNHTGVDIASNLGTKIKSATSGEVVIASEEGDYGKHLKIQIGEVSIIYAHCNSLYVKQGDQVTQGQEIAEVGSTGNSTGPHLHFEIRISERTIDPQKILEL